MGILGGIDTKKIRISGEELSFTYIIDRNKDIRLAIGTIELFKKHPSKVEQSGEWSYKDEKGKLIVTFKPEGDITLGKIESIFKSLTK
jgi:hypothetical protein